MGWLNQSTAIGLPSAINEYRIFRFLKSISIFLNFTFWGLMLLTDQLIEWVKIVGVGQVFRYFTNLVLDAFPFRYKSVLRFPPNPVADN